ncbi:MAG: hypothetical protein QOC56_2850 [Alphaproteobacteria bacterium]|jgi:hypothetical protein|nr:hypothetical protein [Alphaproteobacteria bacterium]
MTERRPSTWSNARRTIRGGQAPGVVLAGMLLIAVSAAAQDPGAPPALDAVPPVQMPNPNYQPGFLDVLGRWLGDSKAKIDEQIRNTADAAKGAAGAAGQATGAIAALPGTRVVIGRQRCGRAPNGAPDCAPAATALCHFKGFGAGKSIDVVSTQKCSTVAWLTGRQNPETDCKTETFVTRAICQ